MSDIHEYSIDKFNVSKLINIINDFYNLNLSEKEKNKIYTESGEIGDKLNNLYIRNDILKHTNQCFLEEIVYKNDIYIYILRTGS